MDRQSMQNSILIAGLSGDSGKTITALSLTRACIHKGLTVSTFKKGPDYIDAAWLSLVSRSKCRNLDTYMVAPDDVARIFRLRASSSNISIIEGNRGIFDGKDLAGTHSTAELAKLLEVPVILCISVTKSTRTVAAMVKGIVEFDPEVQIAGVILSKVAGSRHARIVSESIEKYCKIPVLGAIPLLDEDVIPSRHLGLVPPLELEKKTDEALDLIAGHLQIDAILQIAMQARPSAAGCALSHEPDALQGQVDIGYFCDSAFTFYYPENLEALERNGATLVPISSMQCQALPRIDALYIGGGFPETHARAISTNQDLMRSLRERIAGGLPVYAECGGLMYLSRSLRWQEETYPMAGVYPIDIAMSPRPKGHGYTMLEVSGANPFFTPGTILKGHEFHYSSPANDISDVPCCMKVQTGSGLGDGRDGLVAQNTLATYTHIHAEGTKAWASAMVQKALEYKTAAGSRR